MSHRWTKNQGGWDYCPECGFARLIDGTEVYHLLISPNAKLQCEGSERRVVIVEDGWTFVIEGRDA